MGQKRNRLYRHPCRRWDSTGYYESLLLRNKRGHTTRKKAFSDVQESTKNDEGRLFETRFKGQLYRILGRGGTKGYAE